MQHAPRTGCGHGFVGRQVDPSVWYVPVAAVQCACVVTSHRPFVKQHAPRAGGGGHVFPAAQATLFPWYRPCVWAHARCVCTEHVVAPPVVTQQAPVAGGGSAGHAPSAPHVVAFPRYCPWASSHASWVSTEQVVAPDEPITQHAPVGPPVCPIAPAAPIRQHSAPALAWTRTRTFLENIIVISFVCAEQGWTQVGPRSDQVRTKNQPRNPRPRPRWPRSTPSHECRVSFQRVNEPIGAVLQPTPIPQCIRSGRRTRNKASSPQPSCAFPPIYRLRHQAEPYVKPRMATHLAAAGPTPTFPFS